jgi:ketosteroid isomerase-like protein
VRYFILIAVLAMGVAFSQTKQSLDPIQPTIQLPKELARVLTDYENAWRAKDAAALSQIFSENGFVLSSGSPMVRGRKAIENFYRASGGPLMLRAVAYATDGNVGYILGGFTNRAGAPDLGKFTLTLQKERSGRWMIMSDMDNGNQRPN